MSDCPVCCGIEGYAIHTCEKAVGGLWDAKYTPEASDLATNVRSYEERIADLESKLAAAEADAERLEWLAEVGIYNGDITPMLLESDWRAAIDAALQATAQEGE